jgi:transcriptional regulator with XRE-family HTH domain
VVPNRETPRTSHSGQETALRLLGQAIRTQRRRLHLSQAEIAKRTGLDRTHIGEIENGKMNVTTLNLLRLAAALQIPPSHLFHSLDTRPELYALPEDVS